MPKIHRLCTTLHLDCLFFAPFFYCWGASTPQKNYDLNLKSGKKTLPENAQAFVLQPDFEASEKVEGKYYRYLQFYKLPSQPLREKIEASGLHLLDYLPHNTYIASSLKTMSFTA